MILAEKTSTKPNEIPVVQGEKISENKDYCLLPNAVVSSSDCNITTHASESASVESNRCISSSSGDSSTTVCRICQDIDKTEDLRTLCNCTGSIAKYHVSCLEQWLSVSKSDVCELCHGRFQTKRKAKPFSEWLRCLRSTPQSRYMYGDIFCLVILTPLAMASAALCVEGSYYYISIGQWVIASGLITLCTFLIMLYVVWLVLSMRYHLHMWHKWRQENQVVKLILPATTSILTRRVPKIKETVV